MQTVQQVARQGWVAEPPLVGAVAVTIAYFYDSDLLDVDNIPKPVLDTPRRPCWTPSATASRFSTSVWPKRRTGRSYRDGRSIQRRVPSGPQDGGGLPEEGRRGGLRRSARLPARVSRGSGCQQGCGLASRPGEHESRLGHARCQCLLGLLYPLKNASAIERKCAFGRVQFLRLGHEQQLETPSGSRIDGLRQLPDPRFRRQRRP